MLNDLSPILVTGGAGFIGSNFVLDWLALVGTPVVNLDKLTYAGNLQNLTSVEHRPAYHFEQGDICDPFLESFARSLSTPRDFAFCGGEPRGPVALRA